MQETQTDFELYVARYCELYGVTREEALDHELVRLVREYYEKHE